MDSRKNKARSKLQKSHDQDVGTLARAADGKAVSNDPVEDFGRPNNVDIRVVLGGLSGGKSVNCEEHV